MRIAFPYLFLMSTASFPNRNTMRDRSIVHSSPTTGVFMLLDIIFIALGAGMIAALALYASGLARI